MGWFNVLKVNLITNRDKDNFAKLKKNLKTEMGYEKFFHVEGEGLLDLEKWINGDWPSPEEITTGKTIGESLISRTWVEFSNAVSEIYNDSMPEDVLEIMFDIAEIIDKLFDIAEYM